MSGILNLISRLEHFSLVRKTQQRPMMGCLKRF